MVLSIGNCVRVSVLALTTLISLVQPALMASPGQYRYELIARSSANNGYHLPANVQFTLAEPSLNDQGDVALDILSLNETKHAALWHYQRRYDLARIIYHVPPTRFISAPQLNDHGWIAFEQFGASSSDGLYIYGPELESIWHALPTTIKLWATYQPTLNNDGYVAFRGQYANYNPHSQTTLNTVHLDNLGHIKTFLTSALPGQSPETAFIFPLALNNRTEIAVKLRLGTKDAWQNSQCDQIRKFNARGDSRIIAVDHDCDPNSLFDAFDDRVSITDSGDVVFIATLRNDGTRALYLGNETTITALATEGQGSIAILTNTKPAVNDRQQIAFVGRDQKGLAAIFIITNGHTSRVITAGDRVESDHKTTVIKSFTGGISLNNHGELAFHGQLGDDLGHALFVATHLGD